MTLSAFTLAVERDLELAGLDYERSDLIRFIEANGGFIAADPDAAAWAKRFAAQMREWTRTRRDMAAAGARWCDSGKRSPRPASGWLPRRCDFPRPSSGVARTRKRAQE
jgi:hypothetical protein